MLQDFVEQIERTARDVMDGIHTALPGKVTAFDPAKGVARVKPCGRFTTLDGKSVEYPDLTEVPVLFPFSQTANVGIGFPVRSGDDCLVVLSEVELDQWRGGAKAEGSLRYDLSSAVAIPGLLSAGNGPAARACALNAVVIAAGAAELVISSGGITLNGNLSINVNVTCSGSGPWKEG